MNKNDSVILAFVGPVGSGKGTATSYLSLRYGAKSFKFSTPLRQILPVLDLEVSRDHMQRLSKCLRDTFGQDVLSRAAKREILGAEARISIMDGVRRMEDIAPFLDLPNFVLVYVEADVHIRHERIQKRAENAGDAEKTFEQFLKEEQADAEATIFPLRAHARFVLDNSGDEAALTAQVDEVLSGVLE